MRKTLLLVSISVGLSGCGGDDHLKQGATVRLINPEGPTVAAKSGLGNEPFPAALRATVVFDDPKQTGKDRWVDVKIIDRPYEDFERSIRRENLEPTQ